MEVCKGEKRHKRRKRGLKANNYFGLGNFQRELTARLLSTKKSAERRFTIGIPSRFQSTKQSSASVSDKNTIGRNSQPVTSGVGSSLHAPSLNLPKPSQDGSEDDAPVFGNSPSTSPRPSGSKDPASQVVTPPSAPDSSANPS